MTLLEVLNRYKKKRPKFRDTIEYKYFFQNRVLLAKLPSFLYLEKRKYDEFDIIRINIILRAYQNKILLEEETKDLDKNDIENYKKVIANKMIVEPYLKDNGQKIYIPFFSKVINLIYTEEPQKLLKYPYSSLKDDFHDMMVDPFDTYGYKIYNTYFTRLVLIKKTDDAAAFFNYDLNTLYVINNQGRLDAKIVLFDRFIRHPNYSHMLERLGPVVDAYFAFDKQNFIKALKEQGFLSTHMFYLLKLYEWRKLR